MWARLNSRCSGLGQLWAEFDQARSKLRPGRSRLGSTSFGLVSVDLARARPPRLRRRLSGQLQHLRGVANKLRIATTRTFGQRWWSPPGTLPTTPGGLPSSPRTVGKLSGRIVVRTSLWGAFHIFQILVERNLECGRSQRASLAEAVSRDWGESGPESGRMQLNTCRSRPRIWLKSGRRSSRWWSGPARSASKPVSTLGRNRHKLGSSQPKVPTTNPDAIISWICRKRSGRHPATREGFESLKDKLHEDRCRNFLRS